MKIQKNIHLLPAILVLFCTAIFSGCHDNILGTIKDEVELNKGMNGNITSIAEYNGYLYLAAQRKGYLYRRAISAQGFQAWEQWGNGLSDDWWVLYVRNTGSGLEVLVCTGLYEDEDKGTSTPSGYATYTSTNTSSWTRTATYNHTGSLAGSTIVKPYKDALLTVTANGKTYSKTGSTSINGTNIENDSEIGVIYGLSATSDYLIAATGGGLWKIPFKADGTLNAGSKSRVDEEGYGNVTNIGTTFVHVVNPGGQTYANSTIYACRSPTLSSQNFNNNGLYAIYRSGAGSQNNEWNLDGTDEGN